MLGMHQTFRHVWCAAGQYSQLRHHGRPKHRMSCFTTSRGICSTARPAARYICSQRRRKSCGSHSQVQTFKVEAHTLCSQVLWQDATSQVVRWDPYFDSECNLTSHSGCDHIMDPVTSILVKDNMW